MADARMVPKKSGAAVPTSTGELRSYLLAQMVEVAEGFQESGTAKAICNYAQQVYNTMNMELKHALAKDKIGAATIRSVAFDGEQ